MKTSAFLFKLMMLSLGFSTLVLGQEAPGATETINIGRDRFEFSLSNGTLSVKHYANDAIGFNLNQPDPAPVRSLAELPNFLVIAQDSKSSTKYGVLLDKVSMSLSDKVSYTLGKNIKDVVVLLLQDQFQPLIVRLSDPFAKFTGIRVANFNKFRKIPIKLGNKDVLVPLLPADSIRALLFARGQDVRTYYYDLNDPNMDVDGYFLFQLDGRKLTVSHYGSQKFRFGTAGDSFHLSVPPHPFHFALASGIKFFHLDPADFSRQNSAVFMLPQVFEALEVHSNDPNTLTTLFQNDPTLLRNNVLKSEETAEAYRPLRSLTDPKAAQHSVLISQKQLKSSINNSLSYVNYVHTEGLNVYGGFTFHLDDQRVLTIGHHASQAADFGMPVGDSSSRVRWINPDFAIRFTLIVNDVAQTLEISPKQFHSGQFSLPLDSLGGTEIFSLEVSTSNVDKFHPVFFEQVYVNLLQRRISCGPAFVKGLIRL